MDNMLASIYTDFGYIYLFIYFFSEGVSELTKEGKKNLQIQDKVCWLDRGTLCSMFSLLKCSKVHTPFCLL